jgi:hypothetical protein
MLRKFIIASVLLSLVVGSALCGDKGTDRVKAPVISTGPGYAHPGICDTPIRAPRRSLDEYTPGSVLDTVGTTWYDWMAPGSAGKTITVDHDGYVHFVWTNGLNSGNSVVHVSYNIWDPTAQAFGFSGGAQVDAAVSAEMVTIDVNNDGFAFPAFHQPVMNGHAAAAIDFLPRAGTFATREVPPPPNINGPGFPKIAIDIDGNLHMVSTGWIGNYAAFTQYYSKGIPHFDADGFGLDIDWGAGYVPLADGGWTNIDIATSRHSNRVAAAWTYFAGGMEDPVDVMLRVSEDGGQNWGNTINVTSLAVIDTNCVSNGGDPNVCNGDTMIAWLDLSILIDDQDNVHIAWTAYAWYYWDADGNPIMQGYVFSNIWHWDEQHQEYNIVHEAWTYNPNAWLGTNNVMCQRPSLAIDTTTGYLYCSFQKFDSVQCSEDAYAQADAWVTVSTDGGRRWAEATNITGTDGGINTPAGQCRYERDISLAKFITDDTIHVMYMVDRDAGASIFQEGLTTLNPMIYQRIPVADIPTTPLINPCRNLRGDSTGFPYDLCGAGVGDESPVSPFGFSLYQNYPNPFNATTTIAYDLPNTGPVSLLVYDVLGREIAVLKDGFAEAGVHRVTFDGSHLASGIYFARLDAGSFSQTKKVILLK